MSDDRTASPTELDVAQLQLQALETWHRARRLAERAADVATRSREARMDLDRRLDVIRAQHAAIIARTDEQLRTGAPLLREALPRRAVVAHRNEWFAGKVCAGLEAAGVQVLVRVENGAEAVGVVVAEQPDLLLVEDRLAMLSGEDVVREAREYAPVTVIAAHVAHEDRIGPMLEAGATTAYARRIPPREVVDDVLSLLTRTGQPA